MSAARPSRAILFALFVVASARTTSIAGEAANIPCLACEASVDTIRRALTPEQWTLVERGEIITNKVDSTDAQGNPKTLVQSAAILKFPASQVWSVLVDFESRPDYVPGVKEMKITRHEGNQYWTSEHLRVLLMSIDFQVINSVDAEHGRITWVIDRSVKNDIADSTGAWQIVALNDHTTAVHYRAHFESGKPVPGFIEDFLAKRTLPKVISGMRDEIGRRFPQVVDPEHPPEIHGQP